MTIQQPLGTDPLNIPDHALSHRVFANDNAAPVESVVVNSSGIVNLGAYLTNGFLKTSSLNGTITIDTTIYEPSISTGSSNQLWHGNKTFSPIVESDISLSSSNTTNDVSITKHGFMPTLPGGTTTYYRADGTFASPSSVTVPNAYFTQSLNGSGVTTTVTHNFGAYPLVQILDSSGNVLIPEIINNVTTNQFTVTFSAITNGLVIATLGSPQVNTWISTGISYSTQSTDRNILVTSSGVTITLNSSVLTVNQDIQIKNASNGDVTVTTTSGTIDGGVAPGILSSMDAIKVHFDGTNYYLIV